MNKIRLILLPIMILISIITANAYSFYANYNGQIIYYNITSSTEKTVSVTCNDNNNWNNYNFDSYSGVVIIPSSVSYDSTIYTVTSIDEYAFCNCSSLTSVTIPSSVKKIGVFAFEGCSGLKQVLISDIFSWCNIKFSSSDSNPLNYAHHLFLNNDEVTNLIIPNSVTKIGDFTFQGCSGLTSVTIPDSVYSIGYYSFNGCSGLTSVTIPNSVISIGDYAFKGCKSLISTTIGNSVNIIGKYSFSGCSSLTSVTIGSSVTSIG